jgi:hypothetical protein
MSKERRKAGIQSGVSEFQRLSFGILSAMLKLAQVALRSLLPSQLYLLSRSIHFAPFLRVVRG